MRQHNCDALCGCTAGGIGNNERFHDKVVQIFTGKGLNEEDFIAANGLLKAGIEFAVGKLLNFETLELQVQNIGDLLGEA